MSTSNITVNGKPLEQHLSEEAGREIAQVRTIENEVAPYKSPVRKIRNHSSARTSPGVTCYRFDPRTTHVLIAGSLFNPVEKARYFVAAGNSIGGAQEYDERTKEVKCHACGDWTADVGYHISAKKSSGSSIHSTAKEYRIRYGFHARATISTPDRHQQRLRHFSSHIVEPGRRGNPSAINSEAVRKRSLHERVKAAHARRAIGLPNTAESANLIDCCKEQRLRDLRQFSARLGRTPTIEELRAFRNTAGIRSLDQSALKKLWQLPLAKIFLQAGLVPRNRNERAAQV